MFYIKIQYIFEDIYKDLCNYLLKRFNLPMAKYRISLVERDKETHKLVNEKIMEDNIKDVNVLSRKYLQILKKFYKNELSGDPGKSNSNFYIEISEIRETVKRISYAIHCGIGGELKNDFA